MSETVKVATIKTGILSNDFKNRSTIDDVILESGDFILIKDQDDKTENGIYRVNETGSPTRFLLTKGVNASSFGCFVQKGDKNKLTLWTCTNTSGNDIVGDDELTFETIASGSLKSATTEIEILSSDEPSAGQVLTAISPTSAKWESPSMSWSMISDIVTETNTVSTTSDSYTLIPKMEITPGEGKYLIMFSSSAFVSKCYTGNYSIFVGDDIVPYSTRNIINSIVLFVNITQAIHTQAICDVKNGETINVKYKVSKDGATTKGKIEVYQRSLIIKKLS